MWSPGSNVEFPQWLFSEKVETYSTLHIVWPYENGTVLLCNSSSFRSSVVDLWLIGEDPLPLLVNEKGIGERTHCHGLVGTNPRLGVPWVGRCESEAPTYIWFHPNLLFKGKAPSDLWLVRICPRHSLFRGVVSKRIVASVAAKTKWEREENSVHRLYGWVTSPCASKGLVPATNLQLIVI